MTEAGPCHALRPVVRSTFGEPPWSVVEVDVTDARELAGPLLVSSLPTLVLFVDGKEAARWSRIMPQQALSRAAAGLA